MRILVAMSGGVDSSVAAAALVDAGHEVVGATLKLWGGESDSGCCSVADVEDARRVADRIGIDHHVFNMTHLFDEWVVDPYVAAHAGGLTPNPCVECNRNIKFGHLLERARRLGFDALSTGHHARITAGPHGRCQLRRGRDSAKDQSYVLSMLSQHQLRRVVLPVGTMTKAQVRAEATKRALVTADKPDSQQVCFITSSSGRRGFLGERMALHHAQVVDSSSGTVVGTVADVELVTVGQRRGLGSLGGERRYAIEVDVGARRVVVGPVGALDVSHVSLESITYTDEPLGAGTRVLAQASAHGHPMPGVFTGDAVTFDTPQRAVAPGQTVALYDASDGELLVAGALAAGALAVSSSC